MIEANGGVGVGGKTEMAGVDDAGMNRADGNLVQAFTGGGQEGVRDAPRGSVTAFSERVPHIPTAEIEPGPRVRGADRFEAVEIAHRALQANGRRVEGPNGKCPPGHGRGTTATSRASSSSTAMCTAPVSPHRPSSVQYPADS